MPLDIVPRIIFSKSTNLHKNIMLIW